MTIFAVNIEGFGDLPVNPPFTPRAEPRKRPNGEVHSIREVWSFRSIFPADGTGPDGLKIVRDNLLAAAAQQNITVQIKKDGSVFEELGPNTHAHGAFIENLDVQRTGGEWVSLLLITFDVIGTRAIEVADVILNDKRLTTRTDEEGRVRSSIEISAEGPGAKGFVLAQAPAGARSSVLVEDEKNDRVTATFELFGSDTEAKVDVEETVEVEPGIFPVSHLGKTRSDEPESFWSSRTPTRIRITGSAASRGPEPLSVPVDDRFVKYMPTAPRISRGVGFRAGDTTRGETLTYALEFEVPFKVTIDEVLAGRRALAPDAWLGKADAGVTALAPTDTGGGVLQVGVGAGRLRLAVPKAEGGRTFIVGVQ